MNFKIASAIFVVIFLISAECKAQEEKEKKLKVELNVEAKYLYMTPWGNDDIHIDPYIQDYRYLHNMQRFYKIKYVTDNPFFHSAGYSKIGVKTYLGKNYTLYTCPVVEHRGMSYGVNDLDNIVVFPQLYFVGNDTFTVFRQQIGLQLVYGDIPQRKVGQGLKIYNIDTQGMFLKLKWNKLYYGLDVIGDISFGTGLNLSELWSRRLGITNIGAKNKGYDIALFYSTNSQNPEWYGEPGVSALYQFNERSNIYSEFGVRGYPYENFRENSAFLIGVSIAKELSKTVWGINTEIRYYGSVYNQNHSDPFQRGYRVDSNSFYANTVGRYLYPLKNYYYPFSQWAVYTEYQGQSIWGIELRANIEQAIYRKIKTRLDLEFHSILKEQKIYNSHFEYLFYTLHLYYQPVKNVTLGVIATNKMMNLDESYQTFYMAKYPYLGVFFQKSLETIW